MIVTCPGCSSKYRVRNESVPADGARMRCPKCETLFLAKPPVDGSTTMDDPSSMYQQLSPQGARPNTGAFPAVPPSSPALPTAPAGDAPQAAPGVGAHRGGPITALFAAFDSAQLPPDAQRPPAPPDASLPGPTTPAPTPSGLGVGVGDAPRVRTLPVTSPALREPTAATGAVARSRPPSRATLATSWVVLGLGASVFLGGALTWAWTTEALPLDGALMPAARALLSAQAPADAPPDVDQVRRAAIEATERKDLPSAIVAWRRAKALSPETDRRPSEALAKMLVELGEVP